MPGAGKKKKKKKGKTGEKGGAVGGAGRGAEAKVSAAGTATTGSAAATSLTRATFSRISAGSALLRVEPHDFLIFNAYIPTFNGYYHYAGEANGKPRWSKADSGSEQHIYWAPDGKRQWLMRSRFTPDRQICSAYYEGDEMRLGSSSWNWAKDSTWITHSLSISQQKAPSRAIGDREAGSTADLAAAARSNRLSKLGYYAAGESNLAVEPAPKISIGDALDVTSDAISNSRHSGGPELLPDSACRMLVDPSVHPPQDRLPKPGDIFRQYSNGSSSQLGPFLSDDLSWRDTAPEEVLTRAPPVPFGTFEALSNAALDIAEAAGEGGALAQRRYTITLARTDSQGIADTGTAWQIQRTWDQVHHLVDVVCTNGDPGTQDLKRLEPSETANEKRPAVILLKLTEALRTVIQNHPTAVELHAFLGWGARGTGEDCTVYGLRQRKFEMVEALQAAKRSKGTMDVLLEDARNTPARETLEVLKMSELRKRATSLGIKEEKLEDFYDLDQPKIAIVDAILKVREDPQRVPRMLLSDADRPLAMLVSGTGIASVDGVYFRNGFYGGFASYKNKDDTSFCRVSARGGSYMWKFQRQLGAAACSVYLDQWDSSSKVPVGNLYMWCTPVFAEPQLSANSGAGTALDTRWALRHVAVSALRDDADMHQQAAALYPDFFCMPDLDDGHQQQTAPADEEWARSDKFLTPSALHDAGDSVQYQSPVSPHNDYVVPRTGDLIPPNTLAGKSRQDDLHGPAGGSDATDERWGELSLDEACHLAKCALTEGRGLISIGEGIALVNG